MYPIIAMKSIALDWDMTLTTSKKVSHEISYVGIHPHHIALVEKERENTFLLKVHRKVENTFENILIFETGNSRLRVELDKHKRLEDSRQMRIQLPKEKLILIG